MSISAVYAWPLPEATSTTVVIEICTACGQPAVDDLYRQTRNKLPCVLQLQSQFHVTDTVTLHPSKSPSIATSPTETPSAWARFIGVELHGEESSVAFSRSIGVEFSEGSTFQLALSIFWASTCANLKYTCIPLYSFVQFKFPVYGHTQTYKHTYIHTRLAMQSR